MNVLEHVTALLSTSSLYVKHDKEDSLMINVIVFSV